MRPIWPVRYALIAALVWVQCPSALAEEGWTSMHLYDEVEDVGVRIASASSSDAHQFKVHAPSHETRIWATFLLPADSAIPLDTDWGLRWTLDDNDDNNQDFSLAEVTQAVSVYCDDPPAALSHAGPRYITFAIAAVENLGNPASALTALHSAHGQLRVTYRLEDGGYREVAFSLAGAAAAIDEVLALFGRSSE